MEPHPIRLVVEDDLRRSRLTVAFRLILAIPHVFWLGVWTVGAFVDVILNWFATLFKGTPPRKLHDFLAGYVRYTTHVNAYAFLAANPYPGFLGNPGSYPVDVEIDPPARQSRWATAFRLLLALPALLLTGVLVGFGGVRSGGLLLFAGPVVATVSFLAWFACVVQARMPAGFRDLILFALRYSAQLDGYLFLLTARYPESDPAAGLALEPAPHPVRMSVSGDLRRSRLTVFFRLLLAVPHFVWLTLWTALAVLAAVANWFAALAIGRSPRQLHRFIAAFVRYQTHVYAFLFLVGNPFPGFTGRAGSYPVDLEIDGPARQRRLTTAFRLVLAIPAFIVAAAVGGLLYAAAFLGWFVSLGLGRMPRGLRNLGAYSLRYSAQVTAYAFVLTDRYPHSGPPA